MTINNQTYFKPVKLVDVNFPVGNVHLPGPVGNDTYISSAPSTVSPHKPTNNSTSVGEDLEQSRDRAEDIQGILEGAVTGIDVGKDFLNQSSSSNFIKMLNNLYKDVSSWKDELEKSGKMVAGIGATLDIILRTRDAYSAIVELSDSNPKNDEEAKNKVADATLHFAKSFGTLAENLKGLSSKGLSTFGKFFKKINPAVSAIVSAYDGFQDGLKMAEERGYDGDKAIAVGIGGATGAAIGDVSGKVVGAALGALIGGPFGAIIGGILGGYFGSSAGTYLGANAVANRMSYYEDMNRDLERVQRGEMDWLEFSQTYID